MAILSPLHFYQVDEVEHPLEPGIQAGKVKRATDLSLADGRNPAAYGNIGTGQKLILAEDNVLKVLAGQQQTGCAVTAKIKCHKVIFHVNNKVSCQDSWTFCGTSLTIICIH